MGPNRFGRIGGSQVDVPSVRESTVPRPCQSKGRRAAARVSPQHAVQGVACPLYCMSSADEGNSREGWSRSTRQGKRHARVSPRKAGMRHHRWLVTNPLTAAPEVLLLRHRLPGRSRATRPARPVVRRLAVLPATAGLIDTARAFPEPTIVIDQCSGVARINGFGFDKLETPSSSERLAETWKPWIETCIEVFGPDRYCSRAISRSTRLVQLRRRLWNVCRRPQGPVRRKIHSPVLRSLPRMIGSPFRTNTSTPQKSLPARSR